MKDGPEGRPPRLLLVGGPRAGRERLRASRGPRFQIQDLPEKASLLDYINEHPPDLLLTASPAAQALETLRQLRADPVAGLVPVMLCCFDAEDERAEAFEAGADDVLPSRIP